MRQSRSSRSQMFFKIVIHWKTLEPLFNKVAELEASNLLKREHKRELQHKCFPVNIAKFFRTTVI